MIFPLRWILKRPGILLPVFFLCLAPVSGQISWQEASVAALGNTFVTRPAYCHARHNQAGLGWIVSSSISLQHSRPYTLKELGISVLSAQFPAGKGAIGTSLSNLGIEGLRQSSAWISYGLELNQNISAGLGIHFWTLSIPDKMLFHPGISFALGIQAKINESLVAGAHVSHPMGWYADSPGQRNRLMVISMGCSYSFFQTITYYSDFQVYPDYRLKSNHGLEFRFSERVEVLLGMHNRPFSISGGIACIFSNWTLHLAYEYITDTGSIPSSSFTYAW